MSRSDDYKPEVGDRVRVLLEGTVRQTFKGWFDLAPDDGTGDGNAIDPADEHVVSVEKIEPLLPSTPGSVLRYTGRHPSLLAEDDLRILGADGSWRDSHGNVLHLGPSARYDVLLDTRATA